MENKNYEKEIWSLIVQIFNERTEFSNQIELTPLTSVKELFPPESNTGRNRLGAAMFDMFDQLNKKYNFSLKINYKERKEYILFPRLRDVWLYFVTLVEKENKKSSKEDRKAKVIAFPKK